MPPTAEPAFKILLEHPGQMLMAAYKNVHVILWYASADGAAIEALDEATVPRVREYPSGISSIHVVLPSTGLPNSAARDGLVRSGKRWAANLACVGVVVERKGFWASAMRGAVTGIQLLSPRTFASQVFDSLEQVAEWLPPVHEKRTGVQLEAAELLSVLRRVRELRNVGGDRPADPA